MGVQNAETVMRRLETMNLADSQWFALDTLLTAFDEQNKLRSQRDRIQNQALRLKVAVEDFIKTNPLEK